MVAPFAKSEPFFWTIMQGFARLLINERPRGCLGFERQDLLGGKDTTCYETAPREAALPGLPNK
jgi:hypothetical protein